MDFTTTTTTLMLTSDGPPAPGLPIPQFLALLAGIALVMTLLAAGLGALLDWLER